jgi:hypothetical protein
MYSSCSHDTVFNKKNHERSLMLVNRSIYEIDNIYLQLYTSTRGIMLLFAHSCITYITWFLLYYYIMRINLVVSRWGESVGGERIKSITAFLRRGAIASFPSLITHAHKYMPCTIIAFMYYYYCLRPSCAYVLLFNIMDHRGRLELCIDGIA